MRAVPRTRLFFVKAKLLEQLSKAKPIKPSERKLVTELTVVVQNLRTIDIIELQKRLIICSNDLSLSKNIREACKEMIEIINQNIDSLLSEV